MTFNNFSYLEYNDMTTILVSLVLIQAVYLNAKIYAMLNCLEYMI